MSSPEQSRSLSFDMESLGQPQTWIVYHRGLEYRGEVIVAEGVDPAWGEPLVGDLSFRLVFYTVPRRIPPSRIQDTRIAMVVPGRSPSQARQSLSREIRSIHETRERYVTAQDPDTMALRRSMEEREASLQRELERRYGMAYSQGRIYTHSDLRVRVRDMFIEGNLEQWADRLASAVLLLAHPRVPFDYSDFPRSLTSDDIPTIYRGLFQGDQDAAGLVRDFGPGLGITSPDAPTRFDASSCLVMPIIERELASAQSEMSVQDVVQMLKYIYGLTQGVALLYLMVFVRHARAEVVLRPGHRVESRRGGRFLSDRITWDLIPDVSFSESLLEDLGTLRLQPVPAWNAALPYAALLVDGLSPSENDTVIVQQETLLMEAIESIAPRIEAAEDALDGLEVALGARPLAASVALERLQRLSGVSNYRDFYEAARTSFEGPAGLGESLDIYRRVEQLADHIPVIVRAKSYLDQMTFGREHQELLLEKESVAARIEPDSLTTNPSLWSSVEAGFQRLREHYANAYRAYHTRYHQEAIELRHRLEAIQPQIEALARFNDMTELGEPVGVEVQELFKDVSESFMMCPVSEDELDLEEFPYCQSCLLSLHDDIPRRDAESLFGATARAMREYNRRLSSQGVRQILAHPTREQLDKFINLVQVADPSALANVLDDDVVEFLRQFLRER